MSTWRERASKVQDLLDAGATNADIARHFNCSVKTVENRLPEMERRGLITRPKSRKPQTPVVDMPKDAKETIDRNADGSYSSQKPLWMTLEQVKDDGYLLKAHGFEADKWELVSAKHKIWNGYSKQDGIFTLYSSNVTVKPKQQGWTFDELLEAIKSEVKPVHIQARSIGKETDRMLEIPLFDMHLGNNSLNYYIDTQQEIIDLLSDKRWREVVFVVGQDLLHHDNFKSQTSNGTVISNANMPRAVEDAKAFYYPLIELAGTQANHNVKIIYSKGNHDESMSYMFVQVLKERYPELQFDDAVKERKVHVFGQNFIGITHGDKARKILAQLFPAEFPLEWAKTICREIHAGDLHREDTKGHDEFGIMFRTLSTKNQTDQYHDDNGWTTAHKRFMLFEYAPDRLKNIHYV